MTDAQLATTLFAARDDLSFEYVQQLLSYDPETGLLAWRPRLKEHSRAGKYSSDRAIACWNAKCAGKIAGKRDARNGVISISINGTRRMAHRLAWLLYYGEWPTGEIDHKNVNPSDNRISNLRIATRAQNEANKPKYRTNTSGFKGVCKGGKKSWKAQRTVNGVPRYIGSFKTKEAAHAAYLEFSRSLHGEFARGE